MRKRILDTSVLVAHWQRSSRGGQLSQRTVADAQRWAHQLTQVQRTNLISTPVLLEFLAGVQSKHELLLARSYLDQFTPIDGGIVTEEDWQSAKRFAERVPRDGKRRHLGDCLIKAIAERFRCEVFSLDRAFS